MGHTNNYLSWFRPCKIKDVFLYICTKIKRVISFSGEIVYLCLETDFYIREALCISMYRCVKSKMYNSEFYHLMKL